MLEVGCGKGELALAVAAAGYDVVAIDPVAPEGPILRQIRLEDLEDDARFDAVVASRAFHHMSDLDASLRRVVAILACGGPFVVDEFAWDRLDAATAEWYEGQRRVLIAAGREPKGVPVADWKAHHARLEVHGFDLLRAALGRHFHERFFEEVPYLWRYLDGEVSLALEQTLVAAGAIQPLGFRFVGIPKARPALTSYMDLEQIFGPVATRTRCDEKRRRTFEEVLQLAVEIAREGREGRKIGTLFVVGDVERVLERSRPLLLDPLYGHADELLDVTRPDFRETVKELAQLDGAFLVRDRGTFAAAARYIDIDPTIPLMPGLGTRHAAAASVTRETGAVAIVVSQSSIVRVYHEGEIRAEIVPELFLLSRDGLFTRNADVVPFPEAGITVAVAES